MYICSAGHAQSCTNDDGSCIVCLHSVTRYIKESVKQASLLTTPVARSLESHHIPRLLSLLDKKQLDYGPQNISRHGQLGVLVRIDDKTARIKNLLTKPTAPVNESLLDSWDDIANYGMIGSLVARGEWPKD